MPMRATPKMAHSTVDAYIYAIGGGRGHGARGSLIAQALAAQGYTTELWRGLTPLSFVQRPNKGAVLVVDTFAKGWQGELPSQLFQQFEKRILVSRYSRDQDWSWVNRHYDQVLFPYCSISQEWRAEELRELALPSRHCGLMVRNLEVTVIDDIYTLTVVDPEKRLTRSSATQLTGIAQDNGFRLSTVHHFDDCLALSVKTLVVGAGYNLFYELLLSSADVRFLPVNKRYDDQARRCRNWQLGIGDWDAMQQWLRAPSQKEEATGIRRYNGEL